MTYLIPSITLRGRSGPLDCSNPTFFLLSPPPLVSEVQMQTLSTYPTSSKFMPFFNEDVLISSQISTMTLQLEDRIYIEFAGMLSVTISLCAFPCQIVSTSLCYDQATIKALLQYEHSRVLKLLHVCTLLSTPAGAAVLVERVSGHSL